MRSTSLSRACALCLVLGFCLVAVGSARAKTIVAAGLTTAQVQAAVDSAADGDTVRLPAGTATWTSAVTVEGKFLTIVGAGIDRTTIVGGVYPQSTGLPTYRVFNMKAKPGGLMRLTGMTVDGGSGARDGYNKGMIAIEGTSKTWRIDHIRIRATRTCGMQVYASGGVIDHCKFDMVGWTYSIYGFNGGSYYGDAAWAEDAGLGGAEKPFFVEDNVFTADNNSLALDGWTGERVVFRHNTLHNAVIADHGTESSGRWRGARSLEIYANTLILTGQQFYCAIGLRSGTGVIFDNTITGDVKTPIIVDNFRDFDLFAPWGIATGENPFDKNDVDQDGKPRLYENGTHTGPDGVHTLTCAGKAWQVDQWVGYSVHNTATGKSSIITGNTGNTLSTRYDDTHGGPNLVWHTGDGFRIERCLIALDQAGRGKGKLITGDDPTPVAWPEQASEPLYLWNNKLNGKVVGMQSGSPHIHAGLDFFNGRPRPGYAPYRYPHPLASP